MKTVEYYTEKMNELHFKVEDSQHELDMLWPEYGYLTRMQREGLEDRHGELEERIDELESGIEAFEILIEQVKEVKLGWYTADELSWDEPTI